MLYYLMYSKGGHGEVYPITEKDAKLFPNSDLVKIELSHTKVESICAFYRLKIAKMLFPNNIIDVQAACYERREEIQELYPNYLISKKACVPISHATYSQHTVKNENGICVCQCTDCMRHARDFHNSQNIKKAEKIALKAYSWGLLLPYTDSTDYCEDPHGEIVFFEVDRIKYDQFYRKLYDSDHPQEFKDKIIPYVLRHEALIKDAFDSFGLKSV